MTAGNRKRMTRAITVFSQATKPGWKKNPATNQICYHRFSFCTLTISCRKIISDAVAQVTLVKPFIRWLREQKHISNYLWKKEFQKRGQPHWHLIFPEMIHYKEIQDYWNGLQRKAGYLNEYGKKHGHYDAPSTEIKQTKHIQNMANYLVKELGKSIDAMKLHNTWVVDSLIKAGEIPAECREQFIDEYTGKELEAEGKIWDCSLPIKGVKYYSFIPDGAFWREINRMIHAKEVREKKEDFFTMIFFTDSSPPPVSLLAEGQRKEFNLHLLQINDKEQYEREAAAAFELKYRLTNTVLSEYDKVKANSTVIEKTEVRTGWKPLEIDF